MHMMERRAWEWDRQADDCMDGCAGWQGHDGKMNIPVHIDVGLC